MTDITSPIGGRCSATTTSLEALASPLVSSAGAFAVFALEAFDLAMIRDESGSGCPRVRSDQVRCVRQYGRTFRFVVVGVRKVRAKKIQNTQTEGQTKITGDGQTSMGEHDICRIRVALRTLFNDLESCP